MVIVVITKMTLLFLIFTIFLLPYTEFSIAYSVSYDGFKVYNILPKTTEQLESLKIFRNTKDYDFWSKPRQAGRNVTVMVDPSKLSFFTNYLDQNKISYNTEIENVTNAIDNERFRNSRLIKEGTPDPLNSFLRYDEINNFLTNISEKNSKIVTLETAGQSGEGRDIYLVRISSNSGQTGKPTIFIDAGIHAREWIAPAVALNLINQLVNPENVHLIENVDWIILPSLNPDGYEYSHEIDRLWRKTRSNGFICVGVDANRNFDFHWMEEGGSSFECDEIYAGPEPFSEKEAQALRNYLLQLENVELYLTLHSYGQYLLYPWGYGPELPDNWEELDALGNDVNKAISSVAGTEYTVGSSTNVLYAASGASDDWAMGVADINLVYTIELPGGGNNGFDIPASKIKDVFVETFEGFKIFHEYVEKKFAKELSL